MSQCRFFPDPDQTFFLSPDPDRPKIRIQSSTLNAVIFGQAPPKPYQNHQLDPISLVMDASGSGLLKPGSGPGPGPGSETLL